MNALVRILDIRLAILHGKHVAGADVDAGTAACAFTAMVAFHSLLFQRIQRSQSISEGKLVIVEGQEEVADTSALTLKAVEA